MKKILALIFLSAGCFFVSTEGQAQSFRYSNDALRFSRYSPGGTARIVGIGGAQVALGGDLSSAYSNPAGLGFYNRSELSITPLFHNSANDAYYLAPGATQQNSASGMYDYQSRLGIGNIGAAFNWSKKGEDRSGLVSNTFAVTYQRTNNFHNRITYEGNNPTNTFVDIFDLGTIQPLNELENPVGLTQLAYDAYLIDIYSGENEDGSLYYYYDTEQPLPDTDYPIMQREAIETSGSQGQVNLAYGANIADKIYIGAGVGVTSLEYRYITRYEEVVPDRLYQDFPDEAPNNRFIFDTDRITSGSGINATLGVIARPIAAISVGLSYQTPTLYEISEDEQLNLTTFFRDSQDREQGQLINTWDYRLRTPGRLTAGAAFFLEKWGFLTADIEYVDYSNARLTDDFGALGQDNDAIRQDYQAVVNYRLGAELRYNILRFRAGYAHMANPYNFNLMADGSTNTLSVGAGVRVQRFFVDFAVNQMRRDTTYEPYQLADPTPRVNIENRLTAAMLTLGYNF
ncbi:Outer membrane protein transport protein (OMPP1/FadL/TodX) [Flammeovirgaceae bacterium 311]|nr:Outer membrane protein transport protein (OMPP1/FadL/TodX) [Flammeovirgaceae bacterium 311]